jgi:ankyrin repeat protein
MVTPKSDQNRVVDDENRLAIVNLFLTNQADVNVIDKSGWTPLALAVENNSVEIVKALINHGANQNTQVESLGNETPLMTAIVKDNLQMVELLLSAKPNLSLVTSEGRTALSYARGYRDTEMIERLKKAGAVR